MKVNERRQFICLNAFTGPQHTGKGRAPCVGRGKLSEPVTCVCDVELI